MFTKSTFIVLLLFTYAAPIAMAQVSVEEADRRLKAKLATRPATTQPSTEVERLRNENLRLRERVMSLEQEVSTLKESLARASKIQPGPTTRTAGAATPDASNKAIVGRWRGGDITAGSGYLLQFDADNTYKQNFTTTGQKQAGQYRVFDDTMEMWSDKWPEDKKHNQYRIEVTPAVLTLTPVVVDGIEVKLPRPVVLQRAE